MSRIQTLKTRSSQAGEVTLIVAFMLAGAICLTAQTQQGGSLADAARQARAQKQSGTDASQAQQIANELSEDQNDNGAPGGFKTYNAGEYKVWLPAPYKLEGHDDAGVVISGPTVGSKRQIVMIGTPIAVRWQNDDAAFQNTATNFSKLYGATASCTKTTIASHSAYSCGMTAANLAGTHVSGNAIFLLGSGSVYPVFCAFASVSTSPDKNAGHEQEDAKNVSKSCETVFQSIRFKQDSGQPQTQAASAANPAPAGSTQNGNSSTVSANNLGGKTAPDAASNGGQPVVAATSAQATTTIPTGLKVQPFNYCKSHNDCWNASVLVPAEAKLLSSACKQYAFEEKIQGTAFLLMAGPANADCDGNGSSGPDLVRWNELVDPENKRAPGTYNLVSSQTTTVEGKPAAIYTISFRKGLDSWMGKRVEVESNGILLVVGCLAPRDHFADGDAVCTKLIESLQLP